MSHRSLALTTEIISHPKMLLTIGLHEDTLVPIFQHFSSPKTCSLTDQHTHMVHEYHIPGMNKSEFANFLSFAFPTRREEEVSAARSEAHDTSVQLLHKHTQLLLCDSLR